jgi:hypothetical protein
MSPIEWMTRHGDATDHVIASQWLLLPETQEGDRARGELIEMWHMRFARARIEADLLNAKEIIGKVRAV